MEKELFIIVIQIVIVFSLVSIITLFIRVNNAVKLEKRISKYSVKSNKKYKNLTIFEKVLKEYLSFVKRQRKKIKSLFPTLVKKYEKYVSSENVKAVDYVTHKCVLAILFVLFTIIADAINGRFITSLQFIFCLLVGFFALDVFLIVEKRLNTKKIENDILKSIIIMNNAFKSGKSTIQAVEIASEKLDGPIGYEFKVMYEEMKYGLSVDVVFDRFAKRVNIEEANYLSSSLIILNKTGGNIVAVFDSIEKTLFDKKKLKEELKQSTTVSKLVVKLLLAVPLLVVLIVYIFDPSYFDVFFESTLGYVLLFIIVFMFIIYAYLLDKIVKVDY